MGEKDHQSDISLFTSTPSDVSSVSKDFVGWFKACSCSVSGMMIGRLRHC